MIALVPGRTTAHGNLGIQRRRLFSVSNVALLPMASECVSILNDHAIKYMTGAPFRHRVRLILISSCPFEDDTTRSEQGQLVRKVRRVQNATKGGRTTRKGLALFGWLPDIWVALFRASRRSALHKHYSGCASKGGRSLPAYYILACVLRGMERLGSVAISRL
ncbi:hypothetical protein K437DRAFT_16677 [Tilletiaria anomala UBC 951]|uniref:Uncharacterized protein n=1 Tax=Tilletiaria anomala (strain ATCC 24038 / CBS 436.72 / UBC 951) TaxID=1037660 RepID=A0A066WN09_TILAU|nr:uncharacterized protein K437DRAFT_16677 [Tilletiaria anomala UBC 951]KDN52349.1 hypothetical protein K437DRAFT_16677 [Tilletiaria anomala UBC 951]